MPAAMASPKTLIQSSSPFSSSRRKRSRSRTVRAVKSTSAAGRRGVKLISIQFPLSALGHSPDQGNSLLFTFNPLNNAFDRRLHPGEERARVDPHEKDQDENRSQYGDLSRPDVFEILILWPAQGTEDHAAKHPQHIDGAKDDPGRSPVRPERRSLERA